MHYAPCVCKINGVEDGDELNNVEKGGVNCACTCVERYYFPIMSGLLLLFQWIGIICLLGLPIAVTLGNREEEVGREREKGGSHVPSAAVAVTPDASSMYVLAVFVHRLVPLAVTLVTEQLQDTE